MPQSGILEVELFNVWAINFVVLSSPSHNNLYVLMAIHYVSMWVEAIVTLTNNSK